MNTGLMYIVAALFGALLARFIAGRMDRISMMLGIATGVGAGFAVTNGPIWLLGVCALFLAGMIMRGSRMRGTRSTTS